MNQATVFLAGAPKAGTTFFFNVLAQHPQLIGANGGETCYFMDRTHPLLDSRYNFHQNGFDKFAAFFAETPATNQFWLEGTDHLIYQTEMIPIIAQLPKRKLIFILREPARRVLSSFEFTKNNLSNFKTDITFTQYAEALLADDKAQITAWLREGSVSDFIMQRELEYGHYYNYLREWIHQIGREDVLILKFEDVISDQKAAVAQMLRWLGLSASDLPMDAFEVMKNTSAGIRNRRLHYWMKQLGPLLPGSGMKQWLKDRYLNIQCTKLERSTADLEMTRRLKPYFEGSNILLKDLTGITWDE